MPTDNKAFGRVLVTGAAGFLGRAVADALEYKGHVVLRGARRMPAAAPAGQAWIGHGDVGPHTRWEAALESIETLYIWPASRISPTRRWSRPSTPSPASTRKVRRGSRRRRWVPAFAAWCW